MKITHISDKGIALIKHCEGLRLEAYACPGGKATIGYGHTRCVEMGDKIPEEAADRLLRDDCVRLYEPLTRMLTGKVVFERAQKQSQQFMFDALLCFAFNVGYKALESSTLLRLLGDNDITLNALHTEFMRWVHSGGKELPGLVARRELEYDLFLGKYHYILDPKGRPMEVSKANIGLLEMSAQQSGFKRLKPNGD